MSLMCIKLIQKYGRIHKTFPVLPDTLCKLRPLSPFGPLFMTLERSADALFFISVTATYRYMADTCVTRWPYMEIVD